MKIENYKASQYEAFRTERLMRTNADVSNKIVVRRFQFSTFIFLRQLQTSVAWQTRKTQSLAAMVTVGDRCNMEQVFTFNGKVPAEMYSLIYQRRHSQKERERTGV